uniref:Uncharacterized protein n=1 Tax=Palpitomonas bilix TaxID=652834 RepID=A0A7S3GJY8_9EUKA
MLPASLLPASLLPASLLLCLLYMPSFYLLCCLYSPFRARIANGFHSCLHASLLEEALDKESSRKRPIISVQYSVLSELVQMSIQHGRAVRCMLCHVCMYACARH